MRFVRAVHVALWVVLLLLLGCNRNHEITYRIILPDQYVGWVRVDFEVKTAPAFDSHDALTFRVGKDGRCQTTSLLVYSVPTKYEFLYDTPAGLRPVRDDFVDHAINAGGVTARSDDPHYGTAWYFFIGPKTYRNQHPPSEFTSHSSPLPTPGPLPLQKP
jgi:hypothetical protein